MGSYLPGSQDQRVTELKAQVTRVKNLIDQNGEDGSREGTRGEIVFLMSAINSSTLLHRIRQRFGDWKIEDSAYNIICLYLIGSPDDRVTVLCDLSHEEKFKNLEQSEIETANLHTIEIDNRTYFPAQLKDIPHNIKKYMIDEFRKSFLDEYSESQIMTVHRTDDTFERRRHHAFHIDTVRLAAHEKFQKKLRDYVLALEPAPDVILAPPHQAGEDMAALLKDSFSDEGRPVSVIHHPNLLQRDHSPPQELEVLDVVRKMTADETLLILDDTFNTGARLISYQKHLRALGFIGSIHYVVGVARPADMENWHRLTNLFERERRACGTATTHAVETILLPNWSEADCPWCDELRQLTELEESPLIDDQFIDNRIDDLSNDWSFGEETNIFLTPKEKERLYFNPGSFYGPKELGDVWIACCAASAIQNLRTTEYEEKSNTPRLGQRRFPLASVLKYNDYLVDTWSETLLRASIIRATNAQELIYSDAEVEKQRITAARNLITSDDHTENEIARELLIAELSGKFPNLDVLNNTSLDIEGKTEGE